MDKLHITHGTYPFLKKMKEQNEQESMLLLLKDTGAVLLHETGGNTLFKGGYSYDIFASKGELSAGKFAVLAHFPVRDEGRPLFEDEVSQKADAVMKEDALLAVRGLRPLKGDTYIVVTVWKTEGAYTTWSAQDPDFPLAKEDKSVLKSPVYSSEYVIPKSN
ncbi:antibiotic biosynthesis monooxygenase family protein [Bacillus marinisedimentorum]|uniref:antibiotic biosynthesis monooxygenase family protein n=1 Tax=Bacillus marinisedimentorum TaxID=1821260 RepID=UPI000871C944|nr:antibiotic biosynthesis monooxygenase family protein [Bacillus marinisedimentorum]